MSATKNAFKSKFLQTNRPTDQPTNQPTDRYSNLHGVVFVKRVSIELATGRKRNGLFGLACYPDLFARFIILGDDLRVERWLFEQCRLLRRHWFLWLQCRLLRRHWLLWSHCIGCYGYGASCTHSHIPITWKRLVVCFWFWFCFVFVACTRLYSPLRPSMGLSVHNT